MNNHGNQGQNYVEYLLAIVKAYGIKFLLIQMPFGPISHALVTPRPLFPSLSLSKNHRFKKKKNETKNNSFFKRF